MENKPPMKLMVGIPPIKMVMNGAWFVTLLYQHYIYITHSNSYGRYVVFKYIHIIVRTLRFQQRLQRKIPELNGGFKRKINYK